ncbi:MAG: thymidine phosphorylase [bacterium]|nr:thymidine phosphorylase [bacterium]
MNILQIIEAKKRGETLADEQIAFAVDGFTAGEIPEYQMAALLMAVWFNGMDPRETASLAGVMLASGAELDTASLPAPTADKHSTGGVGDKVSLLLAPLAAACGLCVPMLSGRGLGHTGGTLDKLQAIPGYRIHMENEEFLDIVGRAGCAIVGQSADIAPADGRIYSLRDVTGTVDCVPLITASIMSKKLAAGPRTIVIDLKTGSGAFMQDLNQARELARALVAVGESHGRHMAVLFSDMGQPLGRAIGHANETIEAFAALRPGGREQAPPDLVELTAELTAAMVLGAGLAPEQQAARAQVDEAWDGGGAWTALQRWVAAQDGRLDLDRDDFGLATAPLAAEVTAPADGWLAGMDCRQLGYALADMGGGRKQVEDPLDLACGMEFLPAVGDKLAKGDVVARVHCDRSDEAEAAARRVADTLVWSGQEVSARPLILERF